jgi:type VI secretion system protein ImpG
MGPIGKLRCVAPPTETKRMDLPPGALWKLVSHLSLNHLSLVESDKTATALREILRLYNIDQASEKQVLVDSIIDVQTRSLPGRVGWRAGGFALGTQVTITLDETRLKGLGAYIMACLLDRFLAMYVTINSFTQLIVQSKQRLGQEEPWTWPKRAGEKPLL